MRQWTDALAAVLGTQAYSPFGEPLSALGVAPWGFTGEWHDPTGLVYLRARWYSGSLGRFLQVDPFPGLLWAPPTRHRFAYVLNDPVRRTDPSGLFDPDQIQRYLRKILGPTKGEEADEIAARWTAANDPWSDVLEMAQPGDELDAALVFLGLPVGRIHGRFGYDEAQGTFTFEGRAWLLEASPSLGAWDMMDLDSLIAFRQWGRDVLLLRPYTCGQLEYKGGTEYASENARTRWEYLLTGGLSALVAVGSLGEALALLVPPEPVSKIPMVKALAEFASAVAAGIQSFIGVQRSSYANRRLRWQ